ncbi:MAG TPA: gamma-glutamyltransferase [Solirubrobacteraceae bacterium]|nr:gamma-glutamyltransferase [Solirubrobacteraceae bacterium]
MTAVVAAGHPLTAEAGAAVLRDGGNAVDAAVAAMLMSWVAEPLLTGPGAGGYMLVAGFADRPVLLDFFVAAPGAGAAAGAERGDLVAIDVSFGDAVQVFHVGAAACGAYGTPAGIVESARRWGTMPLDRLAAPAARHAREGVPLSAQQAYVFEILASILTLTPEAAAIFTRDGRALAAGEPFRSPELADTIERLGRDGAEPFYDGDIAAAVVSHLAGQGGALTAEDLRSYEAVAREPVRVGYRGRDVITNPPPSAGGVLIALALAQLDRAPGPPAVEELVAVMEATQAARTEEFVDGLAEPGYGERFLAERLGSTTHISVVDGDGLACSVTCTNGEGCGVVVPGTGIHVNNIMGEEDLSPQGFHTAPPGRRMPSMMAPTAVLRDGELELVVGSAGSNRIRSAILQTIVGVVDHGLGAAEAIEAPRVHFEAGLVYAEPGVPLGELADSGREIAPFRDLNLFFGGVQAVRRDPLTGELTGAGDPRRGGAAVAA